MFVLFLVICGRPPMENIFLIAELSLDLCISWHFKLKTTRT
jgi:hypothetical protein